jgi:predicted dehydrogenase
MNVLIIGNGSIGKQHANTIKQLGHQPIVLTNYPGSDSIQYIKSITEAPKVSHVIICTQTNQHLQDFKQITKLASVKSVFIEKPITSSTKDAIELKKIANETGIAVFVAFDMRFISHLQYVKRNLHFILDQIRLVKINCGQYLPEWRPGTDYRKSYSSDASRGGGVDLDLTHEIDYMLWLFGAPNDIKYLTTENISTLELNSPDYFKGIYKYPSFIVDVELDYFRKADRQLIILGENTNLVHLDFVAGTLEFNGEKIIKNHTIKPLLAEDQVFLSEQNKNDLCTLDESIMIMKYINK